MRFRPGPSTTPTPRARASLPMARPTSESRRSSQAPARVTAVGKQVAGAAGWTPSMSKPPPRSRYLSPCGPSLSLKAGISYFLKPKVFQ